MELCWRMLLALLLGLAIGFERQITGHPAGIRINVLICLGSSFFTLLPILYESDQVFRVGSSIISGVGFLCSGVIFKENGSVKGMNTAATLWCSSAIGVLSSTDAYPLAIAATFILIASNLILRPLAIKIRAISMEDENEREYQVSVVCMEKAEQEIRQLIICQNNCKTLFLVHLESGDVIGDKVEVQARFQSIGKPKNSVLEELVITILSHPDVISAGWNVL